MRGHRMDGAGKEAGGDRLAGGEGVSGEGGGQAGKREAVYDPRSMVIWASGTTTEEMGADHLLVPTRESMGTHFLRVVIEASMELWDHRFKQREAALRAYHGDHMTLKQWIQDLKEQGRMARDGDVGSPAESDSEEQDVDDEWEDRQGPAGPNVVIPPQGRGDVQDELD